MRVVIPVSVGVIVAAIIWGLLGALYAWRDRLIDDLVLGIAVVVELGLIALAVLSIGVFRQIDPSSEGATFLAYALSLPALPPFATLLAIREKSRWSMGVVLVSAFTVAVMTSRVAQIWNLYGG